MLTNSEAKRVMIYGDSLVYGLRPWWTRYDVKTRFTGIAQDILWSGYDLIEEGLRWRMLSGENKFFPYRNWLEQFGPIFASHVPLDAIVLYLGTNDCNAGQDIDYEYIESALNQYRETMQRRCDFFKFPLPHLLLVCPHIVQEEYSYLVFKDIFRWSQDKSTRLVEYYHRYATDTYLDLLDTSTFITSGQADGIHLTEEMNKTLGEGVADFIKMSLSSK